MSITRYLFLFPIWLAIVPLAAAQEASDTATRDALLDRYFQAVSFDEMRRGMFEELSAQVPAARRAEYLDILNNKIDWQLIEAEARKSLARHLTVDELRLLTEFMEHPSGKSAMGKMRYYMADLMPIVQQQLATAIPKQVAPSP